MPVVTGKRLEFRFSSLEAMSAFLRGLRTNAPESALADAAKAHFGSFTVTATLFVNDDGAAVRKLAAELHGTELTG